MRKAFYGTFVVLAAASLIYGATAQQAKVDFTTTDLGSGIYMLEGRGGNIGFSVGDDGVFIIDDQFANLSADILTEIRKISDKPLRYVLNTHFHGDHTGGNENLSKKGATVMAHNNVRVRLVEGRTKADGSKSPSAPAGALPTITYSENVSVHINGQPIKGVHVPNAHTDGDTIVHFKKANIVHMGDTFFSGRYPFIDLASGGTVDGFIAAMELVASKADGETKIIPGHGPLSNKADLIANIEALRGARNAVEALVAKGKSEKEVLAADPLAPWNETMSWGFITGERMTKTLYADLASE